MNRAGGKAYNRSVQYKLHRCSPPDVLRNNTERNDSFLPGKFKQALVAILMILAAVILGRYLSEWLIVEAPFFPKLMWLGLLVSLILLLLTITLFWKGVNKKLFMSLILVMFCGLVIGIMIKIYA